MEDITEDIGGRRTVRDPFPASGAGLRLTFFPTSSRLSLSLSPPFFLFLPLNPKAAEHFSLLFQSKNT